MKDGALPYWTADQIRASIEKSIAAVHKTRRSGSVEAFAHSYGWAAASIIAYRRAGILSPEEEDEFDERLRAAVFIDQEG